MEMGLPPMAGMGVTQSHSYSRVQLHPNQICPDVLIALALMGVLWVQTLSPYNILIQQIHKPTLANKY